MTMELLALLVLLCGVMGAITGEGLHGWRFWLNVAGWAVVGPIITIALALAISIFA